MGEGRGANFTALKLEPILPDPMPNFTKRRAFAALALLMCAAAVAVSMYLYHQHRRPPTNVSGPLPDLLSQLPTDAPVLAFVDVATMRALQNSTLGDTFDRFLPAEGADPNYREFVRGTGFDYTRDLDRAALAVWPDTSDNPKSGFQAGRVLSIADGNFDRDKIRAYALRSGHVDARGSHEVYEVPGDAKTGTISFTFLQPKRIALSSGMGLDQVLELPSASSHDPAMQARLNRVADAPIYVVARIDGLPKNFSLNLGNSEQLRKLLESVRGLALAGRSVGEKLELAADADCDSSLHAFQLATLLDGLRWLGRATLADPRTRQQMPRGQAVLLEKVLRLTKVSHEDQWVELRLGLTPEMLRSVLQVSPAKSSTR